MHSFERDLEGKVIGLGDETNMEVDGKSSVKNEAKISSGLLSAWTIATFTEIARLEDEIFVGRDSESYWTCIVPDVLEIPRGRWFVGN